MGKGNSLLSQILIHFIALLKGESFFFSYKISLLLMEISVDLTIWY